MVQGAAPLPVLECTGVSKRFGGTVALDAVDFALSAGEVHGLVGSNGAGKSTLMKVLSGALGDHEGEVRMEGAPVKLTSPQAALDLGIAMVYQELSCVGQLSVAENMFLGRQPTGFAGRVDWRAMRRKAAEYLGELQIEVDVRQRIDRYPLVVRQMVEIARGMHRGARVLILDEPTSALSPPETRRLFALVERARQRGVGIIFISHFIEDVLEVCDRVTVLRDGRRISTAPAAELDKGGLIKTMLGRATGELEQGYEQRVRLPPRSDARARLSASGLRLPGAFEQVSLSVAPGECLGLYGFVGAGHQELVHALAGARRPAEGEVEVEGRALRPGDVHGAVRRGVVLVAADRAKTLVHGAPVAANVTLAHLRDVVGRWLTRRREADTARPLLRRVGCRPLRPELAVGALSGGNQQKVVVARWLLGQVRVLLLDEPTRGMDVGAKQEVMQLVAELKQQGVAVILASTEPELLLAHADRVLVMRRGRITRELVDAEVDRAMLIHDA